MSYCYIFMPTRQHNFHNPHHLRHAKLWFLGPLERRPVRYDLGQGRSPLSWVRITPASIYLHLRVMHDHRAMYGGHVIIVAFFQLVATDNNSRYHSNMYKCK